VVASGPGGKAKSSCPASKANGRCRHRAHPEQDAPNRAICVPSARLLCAPAWPNIRRLDARVLELHSRCVAIAGHSQHARSAQRRADGLPAGVRPCRAERGVMRQSGQTFSACGPSAPGSGRIRPPGSHPATCSRGSRSRRSGEHVCRPVIEGDETKALVGVEPLHCSCCHQFKSSIRQAARRPRRAGREPTGPGCGTRVPPVVVFRSTSRRAGPTLPARANLLLRHRPRRRLWRRNP
jgi:hypothetical protein